MGEHLAIRRYRLIDILYLCPTPRYPYGEYRAYIANSRGRTHAVSITPRGIECECHLSWHNRCPHIDTLLDGVTID